MNRSEQLNALSETAVNGRIIHKIDLIGMVKIRGVHYFNVYRRYNNVYEIVIEDSNGDFYLQRDNLLRYSIGKVLCLSEQQMNSLYSTELYSFRHGGTPPTSSPAPENMSWTEIHREWCGIEINLRGVFEEYHDFMERFYRSRDEQDPSSDSDSDMDRSESESEEEDEKEVYDEKSENDQEDQEDQEESDEDDYADMPKLISDSEDEPETPPQNTIVQPPFRIPNAPARTPIEIHVHHSTPICCRNLAEAMFQASKGKRTFEQYSSESDKESEASEEYESEEEVSVKEESESSEEEEESRRGSGPDEYIILRNGTKYRKIN